MVSGSYQNGVCSINNTAKLTNQSTCVNDRPPPRHHLSSLTLDAEPFCFQAGVNCGQTFCVNSSGVGAATCNKAPPLRPGQPAFYVSASFLAFLFWSLPLRVIRGTTCFFGANLTVPFMNACLNPFVPGQIWVGRVYRTGALLPSIHPPAPPPHSLVLATGFLWLNLTCTTGFCQSQPNQEVSAASCAQGSV